MRKVNLVPLIVFSVLVSACGGGGSGSSNPKPVSTSSSSPKSSSLASSSLVASSLASSSSSLVSSSLASSSSSSVYSADVEHLRDLATFPIGVAVSNNDAPAYNILTNASEKAVAEKHFNQMTAGNIMKVSYLHPSLNTFSFANADAFVDYANTQDMTIHGHALIWHSGYQVPNFMKTWSGTSDEFLTMLETHVNTIVTHFASKSNVVSWDVVNEALTDDTPSNFRSTYVNNQGQTEIDSPFYVNSGSEIYIEKAFLAARAANATVDLYYNDYNIDQNNAKTTKLIEMITDFQARDIPITGVAFQMHVFMDFPTIANIKAAMQKVVDKGLKVKITELDVSVNNPFSNWPASKVSTFTETVALKQKKRYCEIIQAYKEVLADKEELQGGITVWGTTDANSWLDGTNGLFKTQFNGEKIAWPLLFDEQYNDKPALRGFADGLLGTACTNL